MPTQNRYNPEVVQLVGGLDFVTPRPTVAPGSLTDCFNFEVADALGYKRVTGIEPFDGHPSISNCYNSLYTLTVASSTGANANEAIYLTGDTSAHCFAVITSVPSSTKIVISVFDITKFYSLYSGVSTQVTTDNGSFTFTVSAVKSLYIENASTTITAAIADIITNYNVAYSKIQIASSQAVENTNVYYNPSIGLHWFKDQLYSVVDLHSFVFDTGTSQVYPNDILKNVGAGIDIVVRDVQLISGSWAGGNAVGKILYHLTNSDSYVPGLSTGLNTAIFGPVADSTQLNIVRGATTITNALKFRTNVSGTIPPTWWASLYRSTSISQSAATTMAGCGWTDIDMGYQFSFTNTNTTTFAAPIAPGRNASPSPAVASTVSSLVTAPAGVQVASPGTLYFNIAPPTGADWSYNAGTNGQPQANIAIQSDGLRIYNNSGGGGVPLILNTFSFLNVPADALITGIEIDGGAWTQASGGGTCQRVVTASIVIPGQTSSPVIKNSAVITSTTGTPSQSFTVGSASENWGILTLSPANINSIILYIAPLVTVAGTSGGDFSFDYISVKVYYQTSSSVYYFYNGTDDVQGIITNNYVSTGTYAAATAVGTLQVAQVKPYSTAARSQINSGDIIRTLPAGGGAIVGKVTSNMSYSGLPSLAQITTTTSKYEIIDANFYGNKDWAAIYGVSGAAQSWVYDSFYFRYIYTGLSPTLDLPRHIAFHNFHLCLGYKTGAVLTSATGLPEDFSGVDGAAEFDTGDSVTGFLRMNGTSLAILCLDSIHSLNGTDNSNFSLSVLSPYEGAIEYTAVNCGKPIYASYRGISTLDQTSAYGNFIGNRLSAAITPWLVPRLTKSIPKLTIDSTNPSTFVFPNVGTQYPLFAQPIRAKNQYRLWFADGYFLIMTLMGAKQDPVFTLGQVNLTSGSVDYLIPLAWSSDVDSTGAERNHVSYYNPIQGRPTQALGNSGVSTNTKNYVYELERGWGFAKCPVQGWFTTTHNFFDNPFQIDNIRKIRLHGQSYGAASLSIAVSADYLANDFEFGNHYGQTVSNATPQDISLPRDGFNNSPTTLSSDFQPMTNLADVSKRGRSFSMQFSTNPSTIEPPSVAQALLIQITENKADV